MSDPVVDPVVTPEPSPAPIVPVVPSATPVAITSTVVGTIALLCLICVCATAYGCFFPGTLNETAFAALKDAQTYLIGALTGILVNTRFPAKQ